MKFFNPELDEVKVTKKRIPLQRDEFANVVSKRRWNRVPHQWDELAKGKRKVKSVSTPATQSLDGATKQT